MHLQRHFDCRNQTADFRAAGAGQIKRGAVVDGGADEGQTQSDVHAFAEASVLEYGQALVVVHGEHGVDGFLADAREQGVGGQRANQREPFAAQEVEHGFDHFDFLTAEVAGFASVRVEAGDGDARLSDAELASQVGVEDADDFDQQGRRDGVGHVA